MPKPGDLFSFTIAGNFNLHIEVGSYAEDSPNAPFRKILRIDGVGEFVIPDEAVEEAEHLSSGKPDSERIKAFLRQILGKAFTALPK